jgi:hypothetical protein
MEQYIILDEQIEERFDILEKCVWEIRNQFRSPHQMRIILFDK